MQNNNNNNNQNSPRGSDLPVHTEILLRGSDNSKAGLKEKFVAIYESFFKGNNPSSGNAQFWNELFLLKVNLGYLERCITLTSEEHLVLLKDNINMIIIQCVESLKDNYRVRVAHALETLSCFMKNLFRKKFSDFSTDVINILCGLHNADSLFKSLLESLRVLLNSEEVSLRVHSLQLLVIIVTATDNISQNRILEYFMVVDLFDSLLKVVYDSITTSTYEKFSQVGADALFVLSITVNYRKYEMSNKYTEKILQLKDGDLLEPVAIVLNNDCNLFNKHLVEESPTGLFSRLTGWWYPPAPINTVQLTPVNNTGPSTTGAILLSLYDWVYINKMFFNVVLSKAAEKLPPPKPNAEPVTANGLVRSPSIEFAAQSALAASTLAHFFTYCSHLLNDVKDTRTLNFSKMCLLILTCMVENKEANTLMHQVIYEMKLNKGKRFGIVTYKDTIASAILEIVINFLKSNTSKKMNSDLYGKCLGIVYRIVAFEKKTETPLKYKWLELWTAFFSFLRFVSNDEIYQKPEIMALGGQVARIFNLFITHGDILLTPTDYDELYYEIIRNRKIISTFQTVLDGLEQSNTILHADWHNIITIVNHFGKEVDNWCDNNPDDVLSPEQVKKIIQSNYDSLRLNFQEHLEVYEPYLENPKEASFFRQFIRVLVFDYRATIQLSTVQFSDNK